VALRLDQQVQSESVLFSVPRTFNSDIRTNLYARNRREVQTFLGGRAEDLLKEVTLEQRTRVTPSVELAWGYSVSDETFRIVVGEQRFDFAGILAGPTVSLAVDRRDSPLDATRGWFHSSSLQLGIEPLGSVLGYYRYLLRQTQFVPIGPITLGGSVRWGELHGFSGTAPLSALNLLFTAGGTNSVRGYSEGSLSAADFGELHLGGTSLFVVNSEVRFPIFKWVSGVTFVDAGNTFADRVHLDSLEVGSGFGFRLKTPVAALRLDLGWPISSMLASGLRWHFSVGQMF
jgi:outer membrane protein assembly factor BamA